MPGDKIIGIGFTSVNQQIQYFSRAYKDTEIVSRVEEELYNEYPEFKEKDTYLMVRANKIKRFKTLRENNIRNGDIIQVHIYDEEN
jgi:flagellar biosynthesis/type III secretory pathway chaperone